MIGYKGFNCNWACRNFQYQVRQTYEMPENDLIICSQGFHFCRYPVDVFDFYNDINSVYAIIEANGKISELDKKCASNKITILRQITADELRKLMPPMIHRLCGDKEWYFEGQLHRVDKPAIEYANGNKEWYF